MKSLAKKNKIVLFFLLVILIVVVGLLVISSNPFIANSPKGMRQVKSYDANGLCLAFMPECGYCPGEVKADKCYVKQGVPEQYP